jgi:hypothetical protein
MGVYENMKKYLLLILFLATCTWATPRAYLKSTGVKVVEPGRSVIVFRAPLKVLANVHGFVFNIGQATIVNSRISGSVFSLFGNIRVQHNAKVLGNVIAVFGRVVVENGAYIKGISFGINHKLLGKNYIILPLIYAAFILLIIPFDHFFRRHMLNIEHSLRRQPLECLILGIFYILASIVFLIAIFLSLIGNFLLPILIPLVGFTFFIVLYTTAGMVGTVLTPAFREQFFIEKVLGLAFLTILVYIPMGMIVLLFLALATLGATIKERYGILPIL